MFVSDKTVIDKALGNGMSRLPRSMSKEDLASSIYDNFHTATPLIAKITPYKMLMTKLCKDKWNYLLGLQSWQRNYRKYGDVIRHWNDGDNFPLGSSLSYGHKEDIVFFADFRPMISMKHFSDYVVLKPEIEEEINRYADAHGIRDAIGVHVRYTDKKPKAKLTNLIEKLDKIMEGNPQQKIFLCTDNNDVISDFKQHFGDNTIVMEKYLPETGGAGIHQFALHNLDGKTKEAMFRDSIMDMWLLSKTKELYWQGNSSFSYISKIIKNDPKTTHNWMGWRF